MDLENKAIFTGDSMAFHYLGNLLSKSRDFWQMSGKRPDSYERRDLVSRCFRIQFKAIARNHATLLQASDTFLGRRIGHPDFSRQLGNRHPGIPLQKLQNFDILVISQYFLNLHWINCYKTFKIVRLLPI